jgi:hypothetical protein
MAVIRRPANRECGRLPGTRGRDYDGSMDSVDLRSRSVRRSAGPASLHARRRILIAAVAFFVTFAGVRALTWSIHNGVGPFHDIHMGGRHLHHLVWGILLLLLVGYGWMIDAGGNRSSERLAVRRLLALLYGAGAALTLDEFALWLNLRDVYWAREGRASLDAVVLFAALLAIGIAGAPLWRGLAYEFRKRGNPSRP